MLSVRLIQLVEQHAEELVHAVLADIRSNPRTASFTRVPEADMRHRLQDLYKHLGDWLGDRTETRIEAQYLEVGRHRLQDGVPLEEVVFALVLVKEHLREFVGLRGVAGTALELYSEDQLYHLVGSFFDRALYFTVKGYEEERRRLAALADVRRSLHAAL
jgi:hypothetical protein